MGKFVIECPSCGKYMEASTGLLGWFAKKSLNCVCGYTIDVRTESVASKVCEHCGNTVVYDQAKGEKAICPVCHNKINTREGMKNLAEFTCPSCKCKLSAEKDSKEYICPLCETVIDVEKQIKAKEIRKKSGIQVIKYEGKNDTFVWKHPIEDFNWGSQLIVHESQEAVFFRDGKALDLFGSGRYTLETQNMPFMEDVYEQAANTNGVFHSEIYFVNLATQMGIKWGTPSKIRMFDPASGIHVEIGVSGNFDLKVNNSRKLLLKVVGTESSLRQNEILKEDEKDNVNGKFRPLIINKVKANLARTIKENNINILEIDEYIDILSDKLKDVINIALDEYGLFMPGFYITNVAMPEDKDFRDYVKQFATKTLVVREEEIGRAQAEAAQGKEIVKAQTAAQLKIIGAQGEAEARKIKAQAEAEAYRMQALAEAEAMQKKGYTYQQETVRQVGLEAMKNGITGEDKGGGLGDIASLGITLGTMGSVIGMTKDALSSVASGIAGTEPKIEVNVNPIPDSWNCKCGQKGIMTKCCPECGAKRPEEEKKENGWNCKCGQKGITTKYCPECGAKRPEEEKKENGWNCKCGQKGITTKCCPECGAKRPEEEKKENGWDCKCGQKGIMTKCCPECGTRRPKKEEG